MREELVFRGIALRQIERCLGQLDGDFADGRFTGRGWQAKATALPVERVGSLELPLVKVQLSGDPRVVEELVARLRQKTFRAGG